MKRAFGFPILILFILFGLSAGVDSFVNSYHQTILIYACVNIIMAVSLTLVNGYTGQFSIGHAGFMAVGAYSSAYLSMHVLTLNGPLQGLGFFINTVIGGLVAAAIGYIVGLPSLRLKGDYLAIVTLGFGEIIRVVLLNIDSIGGARGLSGIPKRTDFFWASAWAFVCYLTVSRLMKSTHGRAFISIREDELASESVGVNTTKYKTRAFVLSAFFAGTAGSLFGHYLCYLNPSSFTFMKSVDIIVMVVLGGMSSIIGSAIAAVFITILPELLRPVEDLTHVDFRMVLYSLMLIILMLAKQNNFFARVWFRKLRGQS